jgi:2-hydroxy-6-oxo-6-(2'-carboxyphenyl)-hexa-2,4-dienoate hydrolase
MTTPRRSFLATAAAGALIAPLLAEPGIAASVPPSYDSRLMGAPKFIDVDGIRTRYFDAGRGPVLVLIHGGQWPATASADGFAAIFDRLAASYHVYAFDKLGMGFTDLPKTTADYSMDGIIRHAYGFMRAVGITRAIVAGHSRGALPAARIAVDHPELVSHLIIFDTNALAPDDVTLPERPDPPPATQPPTREQIRAADLASTLSYNKVIVTDASVEAEYRIAQLPKTQEASRRFRAAKEQWVRDNPDRVKANPALVNDSGALVWWMVDTKHSTLDLIRAGHLQMPTCIIWGWNDTFAPYRFGLGAMEIMSKANTNTEMHFVNHAGHFVFAEQPETVTRLIDSFMRAYS